MTRNRGLGPVSRPQGVTDQVYNTIRQAIVEHVLKPGDSVSEASLANSLQVSKTPVRESLIRLHEVGLIEVEGNRGATIIEPTVETIKDAYEVREALESYAASLAVEHMIDQCLTELKEAAQRSIHYAQEEDVDNFQEWDLRFHLLIGNAAGNARLFKLIKDNHDLVRVLRQITTKRPPWATVECATAHNDIVDAFQQRDPVLAAQTVREHIRDVKERVLKAAGQ